MKKINIIFLILISLFSLQLFGRVGTVDVKIVNNDSKSVKINADLKRESYTMATQFTVAPEKSDIITLQVIEGKPDKSDSLKIISRGKSFRYVPSGENEKFTIVIPKGGLKSKR